MSAAATRRNQPRVAVIVLAAGSGSRLQSVTNKAYLPLGSHAVVGWSLRHALELPAIVSCTLVIAAHDRHLAESVLGNDLPGVDVTLVVGGASRHESEWRALKQLTNPIEAGEVDVVVIHDGARPFASASLFAEVVNQAAVHGGAIPGRRQPAVIPLDSASATTGELVTVQTPQAFQAGPLYAAYEQASVDGFVGTDTASCLERYSSLQVRVVDGPADNLKITYPADLEVAARHLDRLD
jgi:2-C-methyl-D-erythritol 4-phosphate cytidylyltransferase